MDTNMHSLRLYPRGFLGSNISAQVVRTPDTFKQTIQNNLWFANGKDADSKTIAANPHVSSVYSDYIRRAGSVGSFEYNERVLKVALSAFGTDRFDVWFDAQRKSPAIGDLHGRFLVDILRFINNGRREMSLETWSSLLVITDEGNNIGPVTLYEDEFFGNTCHGIKRHPIDSSMVDIIQRWCKQPNGLEDLIGTLHILFGKV